MTLVHYVKYVALPGPQVRPIAYHTYRPIFAYFCLYGILGDSHVSVENIHGYGGVGRLVPIKWQDICFIHKVFPGIQMDQKILDVQ